MSMASTKSSNRFGWLRVRVLIIGRANAGKTTILQRVCDTTDSPKVYRVEAGSRREIQLESSTERSNHNIDDELIFSNHRGYIFHDSRGFESGGKEELKIVQNFVRKKATEKRLRDRLHAIWYCIPMDGERPFLDLKFFNDICPDKNVPIIAVFTKYDQFRLEMEFKLEDSGWVNPGQDIIDAKMKKCFEEEYLGKIDGAPSHVQLENMNNACNHCNALIEVTAEALQDDTITVMFLAVQKVRLEKAMLMAATRTTSYLENANKDMQLVVKRCMVYFPVLWLDNLHKCSQYLSSLFQQSMSSFQTHHQVMIAIILVLDLASVLNLCQPHQNIHHVLQLACSQAEKSGVFTRIVETFSGTYEHYALEFCHAFLLQNRLIKPD